ncbi:Alpha/Beta hydrolase protein [Boletus coccyginus]|nr:Alpha/Beta hydrolase protein [Boletus coccyginus]
MTETPFTIAVPDDKLDLLRRKLELATLPDELDDADWTYGVPLSDIKRLTARWKDGYDWRTHEKALNDALPMFTRDVDVDGFGTLNVHYVHVKSTVTNAIPLLFCHGWPGSFYEVRKLLPLLTDSSPDHPNFHVVALSLPGYGFSEAPRKQGFAGKQYAEVAHKLMLALGYDEYVTQGGDWGLLVTWMMGLQYGGKHHKAWHTNFAKQVLDVCHRQYATLMGSFQRSTPFSPKRATVVHRLPSRGKGYFIEQSTQPQTLGYSLADSPVGLLAWIYEKLHNWTDDYPWEDDEVLTWVSIYWFSRAGPTASLRIYFEVMGGTSNPTFPRPPSPTIPMGASFFPKEVSVVPRAWVRRRFRMQAEFDHDSGGHFPAYEKPRELADDLRRMFEKGGCAYGVVAGKDGYA